MDTQMDLPFPFDQAKFTEFLTRWLTLEDKEDRLREDKRLLKAEYQGCFPMRGVLTAVKVLRAEHQLEGHPREGMSRTHLAILKHEVAALMQQLTREKTTLLQEAQRAGPERCGPAGEEPPMPRIMEAAATRPQ